MLFEAREAAINEKVDWRLNPYSNGICSLSQGRQWQHCALQQGLNPYSNGICSLRS